MKVMKRWMLFMILVLGWTLLNGCVAIPIEIGTKDVIQLTEYDLPQGTSTPSPETIQALLSATASLPTGNEGGIEDNFTRQVLDLVNTERAKVNVGPLSWNSALAMAAYGHATDMANRHFLGHYTPEGIGLITRLQNAGYSFSTSGENVGLGMISPEMAVQQWMNSSGHRANILNSRFNQLGVGYRKSATSGTMYWVQDFGSGM